jgi:hypothetical protein
MTDAAAATRRPRLSKRALRAWAWIAGAAAVFAPLGALAVQPRIPSERADPRPTIVKNLRRRIIVVAPQQRSSPPRVVYVGGGSSAGGSAPAPPATTGGSAVP